MVDETRRLETISIEDSKRKEVFSVHIEQRLKGIFAKNTDKNIRNDRHVGENLQVSAVILEQEWCLKVEMGW